MGGDGRRCARWSVVGTERAYTHDRFHHLVAECLIAKQRSEWCENTPRGATAPPPSTDRLHGWISSDEGDERLPRARFPSRLNPDPLDLALRLAAWQRTVLP